jgi:hypothetical protein
MECGAAKSMEKILFKDNFPEKPQQSEIKHNRSDWVEHPPARRQASSVFLVLVYHFLLTETRSSVTVNRSEKKGYVQAQMVTNAKLSQGR